MAHDEAHLLTPDQRARGAALLGQVCDAIAAERAIPAGGGRDEPPELWLQMLARFRSLRTTAR
ncbi:MAG: hypothetical protein HYZ28_23810 [Myxococcales bacterium]|nr:hypothetical protein [Myxococcales bacterium]